MSSQWSQSQIPGIAYTALQQPGLENRYETLLPRSERKPLIPTTQAFTAVFPNESIAYSEGAPPKRESSAQYQTLKPPSIKNLVKTGASYGALTGISTILAIASYVFLNPPLLQSISKEVAAKRGPIPLMLGVLSAFGALAGAVDGTVHGLMEGQYWKKNLEHLENRTDKSKAEKIKDVLSGRWFEQKESPQLLKTLQNDPKWTLKQGAQRGLWTALLFTPSTIASLSDKALRSHAIPLIAGGFGLNFISSSLIGMKIADQVKLEFFGKGETAQ